MIPIIFGRPCAVYDECDSYTRFVPDTKAVFGVEYCDLGNHETQVRLRLQWESLGSLDDTKSILCCVSGNGSYKWYCCPNLLQCTQKELLALL